MLRQPFLLILLHYMIQLQYSASGVNSIAVYSDTAITASNLAVEITSSFSNRKEQLVANVTSNKTNSTYGGWILAEISSSSVPTSSGQYFANIYDGEFVENPTWANETRTWGQIVLAWSQLKSVVIPSNLLTQDRALVSGSDYDTITDYSYQDEATYTVYNG